MSLAAAHTQRAVIPHPNSRSARWKARAIIVVLFVLFAIALWQTVPVQPGASGEGDASLFAAVTARIRINEPYYAAMGAELRTRGYPAASVFNWRTPIHLQAIAAAPRASAVLLIGLAIVAVAMTTSMLSKISPELMLVALFLQIGAAAAVLAPEALIVPEVWLGYLLLPSVAAHARGWHVAAALIGILALFIRELAAPYCVICGLMAIRRHRWRELAVWAIGAMAFAVYFWVHWNSVQGHLHATDQAHVEPWLQFGGLPFVLGTIGFTGWLSEISPWGPAIGVVLISASAWAPTMPVHLKMTTFAYLVFFSAIGQVFNQYWGLITAPVWCLACGYGFSGLHQLLRRAFPHTTSGP